jgi:Zn-finger protein
MLKLHYISCLIGHCDFCSSKSGSVQIILNDANHMGVTTCKDCYSVARRETDNYRFENVLCVIKQSIIDLYPNLKVKRTSGLIENGWSFRLGICTHKDANNINLMISVIQQDTGTYKSVSITELCELNNINESVLIEQLKQSIIER